MGGMKDRKGVGKAKGSCAYIVTPFFFSFSLFFATS